MKIKASGLQIRSARMTRESLERRGGGGDGKEH